MGTCLISAEVPTGATINFPSIQLDSQHETAQPRCYSPIMNYAQRVEIELKLAEFKLAKAQQATADALLTIKKTRWYELVIFGGGGITVGLGIAQLFLR
jgi:hypothetical protein